MANEQFGDRKYVPTTPDDLNDPPRFSQLAETTKDAFVLALRRFFDRDQTAARLSELVTVEKYAVGYGPGTDPYETTVQIFQEFPDVLEQLPHVSVNATSGRHKPLSFGRPFTGQVQFPPRVEGTAVEPFGLVDGDTIVVRTQPDGVTWTTSTLVFPASRFPTSDPVTTASALDVVRVINEQALHLHAQEIDIGGSSGIRISTGGPFGKHMPNAIEVLSGTALTALGLTVGQSDNSTNTARPPMNRYHHAAELTVNIDIITPDVNTRRELTDLVYSWATFWLEQQRFELLGRSIFDEAVPDEHYHVIIHPEVSFGAEQSVQRPNDMSDKVHLQRVTIPVMTIMYLDRPVVAPSGANWTTNSTDIAEDDDLPIPS